MKANLLHTTFWLLPRIKPRSFLPSHVPGVEIQTVCESEKCSLILRQHPLLHKDQLLVSSNWAVQKRSGRFLTRLHWQDLSASEKLSWNLGGKYPPRPVRVGYRGENLEEYFRSLTACTAPYPHISKEPPPRGWADIPGMDTGTVSRAKWYVGFSLDWCPCSTRCRI